MLHQKPTVAESTSVRSGKSLKQKVPVKKSSAKGDCSITPHLSVPAITTDDRHTMIAKAAFYIAEQHGFQGDALENWLQAEVIIDARLATRPATQTSGT